MDSIYNYNSPNVVFRFDDISKNTSLDEVNDIAFYLRLKFPNCRIIYGISPIVFDMSLYPKDNPQRVFPKILTAQSIYQNFYKGSIIGVPEVPPHIEVASHGLFHIDSRLLTRECQEMNILSSCALVNSMVFIPPFNKWNRDTVNICKENNIQLFAFEDGWKSIEHNQYDPEHKLWYLHHWAFGLDKVKAWLDGK